MVGCVLKFLLSLLGLSCRAPIKIQFEAKELEPIILQVYFLDCQHYLWHINIINVNGNLQCLLWGSGICYLKWDSLPQKGIKRQRFLTRRNWTTVAKAVAIPVAPSSPDNAEYRQQLSESYGFKQIGEPLPDNVTLKHVIDTLPKKVLFFILRATPSMLLILIVWIRIWCICFLLLTIQLRIWVWVNNSLFNWVNLVGWISSEKLHIALLQIFLFFLAGIIGSFILLPLLNIKIKIPFWIIPGEDKI